MDKLAMLPEEFKKKLKKHRKLVFMYEWEYFSKRIQDELLFSAIEGFQFLYIEISFSLVQSIIPKKERSIFWNAFLKSLDQKRYSDICGFLKDRQGIAIIFNDSNASDNSIAWQRFAKAVQKETNIDMQKWPEIIRAEYPPKEFLL